MKESSAQPYPSAEPRYYQAPDRYDRSLYVWLPVVGGISAVVLGTIYAFVDFLVGQMMESPGWMCIVTPAFALGLVGAARWICWLGNVRSPGLRRPIGLVVGTLGLYAAWDIYLNFATGLTIFGIVRTWHMPPRLWHDLRSLAADRGISSWLQWFLEAATIYGFIVYFMSASDPQTPFCEQCKTWTKEAFSFELSDKPGIFALNQFTQGQFETLQKLGPRQHADTSYLKVCILECSCLASRFVSLDKVRIKRGTKGGLHFHSYAPHTSKLYYDFGSFDSNDVTPLVTNMEITEKMRDRLEEIREKLVKAK